MPSQESTDGRVDELWASLQRQMATYLEPGRGLDLVSRAYRAAQVAHQGQRRASGEPFLAHPLEVACILADLKLDPETIAAALLHDVLEDSATTHRQLQEAFGAPVADLVAGVTKLAMVSLPGTIRDHHEFDLQHQTENLRRIFLAMARDIRVIFIRLADRLHNMRTLAALAEGRQRDIARETLEIYAPIAGRLGLWDFKWQLEDLSFAVLEPQASRELADQVSARLASRQQAIDDIKTALVTCLEREGLSYVAIEGRSKHLYSIHRKLQRKSCSLDDLFDLLAVRIIVDTVSDCYRAFGLVQSLWLPIPGRFKDHIAMPKPNGYRSLHTTVLGPDNTPVEIQIRTRDMHQVNEHGIAAHWAYKEGRPAPDRESFARAHQWIAQLLDWHQEAPDDQEHLHQLTVDLLSHEIFVFTPKGNVIDLPAGSTPLDFAYRIHTQVGHRFIGTKVNSKIAPLNYRLRNADIVEVLTSNRDHPSWGWLKIVKSRHARSKIRQWFKREGRSESIERGQALLAGELKARRIPVRLADEALLALLVKQTKHQTLNDLFSALGFGEASPSALAKRLARLLPAGLAPETLTATTKAKKKRTPAPVVPVIVPGLDHLNIRLAKCCDPQKGQRITGYISQGRVTVHRINCSNYRRIKKNPDRIVRVRWRESPAS